MKLVYRKRFLKDMAAIPSTHRKRVERFVFEELPNAGSIYETGRFERLQGHPRFHRARFGDYRLGLRVDADRVILERILHRKDFYRRFP